MTEQVPSKKCDKEIVAELRATSKALEANRLPYSVDLVLRAANEIESLQRQVDALSIHSAKWVTRALELQANIARITGERESPHCSTCACPPYEPGVQPDVVKVIQEELDADAGPGAPGMAERIATALGAADLLWRSNEPRDGQ